jgi:hypothetical protein
MNVLLRKLLGVGRSSSSTLSQQLRPRLERLEDRTVPAVLHVNPSDPHAFHTIQAAIAAAHAGDAIQVAPALYHEDVIIDKSLLLIGQPTAAGQKPVISGAGGAGGAEAVVRIADNVSNVLVRGFGIMSPQGQTALQVGVAIGTGDSNIQVVGNNIHDLRDMTHPIAAGSQTTGIVVNPKAHAVLIAQNAIYNITYGTTGVDLSKSYAYGVLAFSSSTTDGASEIAIRDNVLNNIGDIGIAVADDSHEVLVDHNIVTHVQGLHLGYGIATGGTNGRPSDVYIEDNRVAAIAGSAPAGIAVGDTATGVTLIGNHVTGVAAGAGLGVATTGSVYAYLNDFTNNAFGVYVRNDFTGSLTMHGNNIAHNSQAGVENESTKSVDAQSNWWGSASGPTNSANPQGTGDKVIGPVDFSHWLVFPVLTSTAIRHTANPLSASAVSELFSTEEI